MSDLKHPSRPFISATLIVRDEAHHLPDCLNSLIGFADEVVVVDTGSVDATRDIATKAGARLFDFPWCDDFSAARNVAMDQARGEWLLYIDADERVRRGDASALRSALAEPDILAATVCFHPRTGGTAYPEYRLIRNRPDVRFEGAMHESFLPDIHRVMEREGGRIAHVDVVMDHVGYDGDQSHKLERNLTLLTKQIEATPQRVYLWWHLGTVYRDLGQVDKAKTSLCEGVRLAQAQGGMLAEDALCFIELAKLQPELDDVALDWIAQGLELRPENLMLQWLKARALVDRSPTEATSIFESLARIDPDQWLSATSYDQRIMGAGAMADLGYMAFKSGQYADAVRHYGAAQAKEPGNMEYRLKLRLAQSRLAASRA